MKTSKYILFSFLGFTFCITMLLFSYSLDEKYKFNDTIEPFTIAEEKLPYFSIIVAEKGANIRLRKHKTNTILANVSEKDKGKKLPKYTISNDTLYIYKNDYESKTNINFTTLKGIIGKEGSDIHIGHFNTDSLFIRLHKSKVRGWLIKNSIDFIDLKAYNKSEFRYSLNSSTIKNFNVKVNNSNVYYNTVINYESDTTIVSKLYNLKTTLKNDSYMRANTLIDRLDLVRDTTSTYDVSEINIYRRR